MKNLKDTNPYHVHASTFKYGDRCDACAVASGMEPIWGEKGPVIEMFSKDPSLPKRKQNE